ncbi:hypothetical protein SAY86_023666 [Trapa natans]|uniref:Protein kinase domain-containing protein n=1 Tax=Trapa natans TaxID=22666 RepID=A0AAN7RAF5_TRANT|nr:hypothetical protein SAY86_023666 [Trapa natans]
MGFVIMRHCLLFMVSACYLAFLPWASSGDADALLSLKSAIDPLNRLQWQGNGVCRWQGVKDCKNGRVTKLVLEFLNLTGTLDGKFLNQLDQLRVLSFKGNSLSGPIPNLSGLVNLKSLYLNSNNFSGEFPTSVLALHRLMILVLAGNQISGSIPVSLANMGRLTVLYLQDNKLTGMIPLLNQTNLRFFNVSNNQLSGEIPETHALLRFNASSFSCNINLCGVQVINPCRDAEGEGDVLPSTTLYPPPTTKRPLPRRSKLIEIIVGSLGGVVGLVVLLLLCIFCKRKQSSKEERSRGGASRVGVGKDGEATGSGMGDNDGQKEGGGGGSWEDNGIGNLVFLGGNDQKMSYSIEDLLKGSAETLGRGTIGSTYKAMMESGYIVTVKRLKDARYPSFEEFRRQMDLLGRLRHPNVVPLRAYFQAKEERLLVYDYFPNGSLFTLIHGSRTSGSGKPLHWTSCIKIAEDLATGLLYIHQNHNLIHGNLKSSNVLLGPDFESCLTDYGLSSFWDPNSLDEFGSASLFYRAPECRENRRRPMNPQCDVYSFGVLLLELLTGKSPFHDLVQEQGPDIASWVRLVREEEIESGDEPSSGNEASEEKLQALLNIAMACVCIAPDNRPTMREVLKMVRDARADAQLQISSNSSDHSPGRWSDTVQSLPRGEHQSIYDQRA